MKKILFIVVSLIVYGSLYPWHFQHVALTANPLWILLHSWYPAPDRFGFRDAAVNVVLYIPFGVFCFFAAGDRKSLVFSSMATLLAAAALSASVEMIQLFDLQRICSLVDVACNVTGAMVGIVLATAIPEAIEGVVQEVEGAGAFRLSGAVALLYLWLGFMLFPFFPSFSLYAARLKVDALLRPESWMLRDFLESFGGWLAAYMLLEHLFGQRAARIVPLALLLIPLKLLIAGRSMSDAELAGALAAVACWMLLSRWQHPRWQHPKTAAGVLDVMLLFIGGLIPFHFTGSPVQRFTWIPFLPLLQTEWAAAFVILLRKSFLYGSAIWLLKDEGRGWMKSSLLVAIPLAAVEAMQIFLPGRTAESTDPLIALLLGFGLMLLDRHTSIKTRGASSAAR